MCCPGYIVLHAATVYAHRRGSRIQKGGGSYIQKGGFRTGISGADPNCCRALGKSTSNTKLQTAVGGGGSDHPPKKPVSAPGAYDKSLYQS